MSSEQLYGELEHILTQLGIEIRIDSIDEEFDSKGGLCTMNGKALLIVNRKLNFIEMDNLIIQSLRTFNLEDIHIKPYVREVIEGGLGPT